jgi:transcriptional regulator with XRE-family HTH domain
MLWHMKSPELLTLLGVRIRTLRKASGITQERLAELADINLSYMSEIERGQANVSLTIINGISNALGKSITDLLNFDERTESWNDQMVDFVTAANDLDKEKQTIFVEVVKGLLSGLQKT